MTKRATRAFNAGLLLIVAVALAMGGLALAQTGDGGPAPARAPNAAYQHILDLLAPLVDNGTITDAQAAAVAERLADTMDDRRPDAPAADLLSALAELLQMPAADIGAAVRSGTSVAELAEAAGVDLDELVDRVLAPMRDRLAAAVAAGDLTEDEAARRLERASDRVTDHLTSDTPRLDRRIRELEEQREQIRRRNAQKRAVLDVLAVTADELHAAAAGGDSLADVAEAQGVDTRDVVDVLIAPLAERLEDAVAEGDLSDEEAARHLAEATARATERVERPIAEERPPRDRRPRDRARPHRPRNHRDRPPAPPRRGG